MVIGTCSFHIVDFEGSAFRYFCIIILKIWKYKMLSAHFANFQYYNQLFFQAAFINNVTNNYNLYRNKLNLFYFLQM